MSNCQRHSRGFVLPVVLAVIAVVSTMVYVTQLRTVKQQQIATTLALQAEFWFWQQQLLKYYQQYRYWPPQLSDLTRTVTTASLLEKYPMQGQPKQAGYELSWSGLPAYASTTIAALHPAYSESEDRLALYTPIPKDDDLDAWIRADSPLELQQMTTDLLVNDYSLSEINDLFATVTRSERLWSAEGRVTEAQVDRLELSPVSVTDGLVSAALTEIFAPVEVNGDINLSDGTLLSQGVVSRGLTAGQIQADSHATERATAEQTQVGELSAGLLNNPAFTLQATELTTLATTTHQLISNHLNLVAMYTDAANLGEVEAADYFNAETSLLQNYAQARQLYDDLYDCIYGSHYCLHLEPPRFEPICSACVGDMNGDLVFVTIEIKVLGCRFYCDVYWSIPNEINSNCESRLTAVHKSYRGNCTLKLRNEGASEFSGTITLTVVQRFDPSKAKTVSIPLSWYNIRT